jgi:oligopeptide transport system ATP-binding protein
MSLLEVKDLCVEFHTEDGVVRAVDRVSWELNEGEVLGVVGESGSGKSVSTLAVMGLLPMPPARIPHGQILFNGEDLLKKSQAEMRSIRGKEISMIFQDPFTSLNPYLKVSTQLMEVLETHSTMTKDQARKRCLEVLEQLGIPEPEIRFNSYPHQLSGGLKQRIMIAMGLLLKPKVLIADEPTTALDVTIQAQIMELLADINKESGTSIILITHDLGVVAGACDRIQVMYGGRLAERGTMDEIFYKTKHPYTDGLMRSIPSLDTEPGSRLHPIPGNPPDLSNVKNFCAFNPRCSKVQDICKSERPSVTSAESGHFFECHYPLESSERKHGDA